MTYNWKPQVGCLTMLLMPMALATGLTEPLWNWERHALPAGLKVDAVLASSSESGFREGCQSAVYRLSAETADAIKSGGPAYLEEATPTANKPGQNPFGRWQSTPGEVSRADNGRGTGRTIYGLHVIGGCGGAGDQDFRTKALDDAWANPGSYYTITANREGIIIVDPNQRLVGYFYFG